MTEDLTTKDLILAARAKADADFYFFLAEICEFGYNPDPTGPRITEDQHELATWLQAKYDEWIAEKTGLANFKDTLMILAPRDTLKSTVLQIFALWLIVKHPNIRLLFYGEVHEQAQKRMAVVKKVIESCRTFRLVYGELNGATKGLTWNEEMIFVATRTNTSIREATIETAGLDVVINSRHFDWIFPDDLHSEKNTKTREQIDNVKEKVQLLTPLQTAGGRTVFAGVFWNDSDIYSHLLSTLDIDLFRRSAYADEEHTIPQYPQVLSLITLEKKRKKMTPDQFSCHYLLDPVSKESQKFKREFFTILKADEFQATRTFLLIDPAGDPTTEHREKRDSDFYGMVVVHINPSFDLMIREMFMERVNPTEAVEAAISLILKFHPFIVGIEKTGLGNMRHYLEEELRKRKRFAIIEDLEPKGRSKYARVIGLEPLARRHKIYIAAEAHYQEEFFDQILRVTNGIKAKHDDLIDPLAYTPDLLQAYGIGDVEPDSNEIPPELRNLEPISRDYWMAVRKAKEKRETGEWSNEFEHF